MLFLILSSIFVGKTKHHPLSIITTNDNHTESCGWCSVALLKSRGTRNERTLGLVHHLDAALRIFEALVRLCLLDAARHQKDHEHDQRSDEEAGAGAFQVERADVLGDVDSFHV